MNANDKCLRQPICIIELLQRQGTVKEDIKWSSLLTEGYDLCKQKDKSDPDKSDQALQSFEQALQLADDLISDEDPNASLVKASSLLCAGALSFCWKKYKSRAVEYFRRAETLYADRREKYGQAVALFALGWVYESYDHPKEWREIFRFYEQSQRALSVLGHDPDAIRLRQEISKRLDAALGQRQQEIGSAAPAVAPAAPPELPVVSKPIEVPDAKTTSAQVAPSSPATTNLPTTRPVPERGKVLEFLPIFGRIAAGTPVLAPDQAIGYVETDRILINGRPYYVSDGDSNTVRLHFSSEVSHVVLRVVGDSMDKAGIEDGDYVVLRMSGKMALRLRPEDGDIVAVALPPEGNEITLKRFRRRGRKISFVPESTNSMHLPHEFDAVTDFDLPIHVAGILAAVLKPLLE